MSPRRTALLASFAGGVLVAGCSQAHIGQGPIRFGPELQASYDRYLDTAGPGAFAVSTDGAAAYTYCSSRSGCRGSTVADALSRCRKMSQGECHIYDIGGHVVWRDATPATPIDPDAAAATPG